MARYKEYSYDQGKLIPISFNKQIIPGSFEFALNDIVDNVLDLSVFEGRFCNDETGAPAYDPRVMLKIVLYAMSIYERRSAKRSTIFVRRSARSIMKMLVEEDIDGYVADHYFRKRDPKFATCNRHKKPIDRKQTPIWKKNYFCPSDFKYNESDGTLTCPAGNPLYVKNSTLVMKNGQRGIVYQTND